MQPDPIKILHENLTKNGVPIKEQDLYGVFQSEVSAAKFYDQHEDDLGVEREYWMSHVKPPSNFDVELENVGIEYRNARKEYKKIQDVLRSDALAGKQSPNELFVRVEELDATIKELSLKGKDLQRKKSQVYGPLSDKGKDQRDFFSSVSTTVPDTQQQSIIKQSGIIKEIADRDGTITEIIHKEQDQLQPYLSDIDKGVYAVKKQMDFEEDNLVRLRALVKKYSGATDEQSKMNLVAAQNALQNSETKYAELNSFLETKKLEDSKGIDDEIKALEEEKKAIIASVAPGGNMTEQEIELILKGTKTAAYFKIKDINEKLKYAKTKKEDFIIKPGQAMMSDQEELIDKIDLMLPGMSGDPQTKISAYGIALKRLVDRLKGDEEDLLKQGLNTQNTLLRDEIRSRIQQYEGTLKEIAPIALLNKSNNSEIYDNAYRLEDKLYSSWNNFINSSGRGAKAVARGLSGDGYIFGIDVRQDADIALALNQELEDLGVAKDINQNFQDIIFGDSDQVETYDKIIDSDEVSDAAKEFFGKKRERALGEIGRQKENGEQYGEMAGMSLAIMGDLIVTDLLISTGLGAGAGVLRAAALASKVKKLEQAIKAGDSLYKRNKFVRSFVDGLTSNNIAKAKKAAENMPRAHNILGTAFADGIKWKVAGQYIDPDQKDELTFGAGFLSTLASEGVEALAPKVLSKSILGMLDQAGKKRFFDFTKRIVGGGIGEYGQENVEDVAKLIETSSRSDIFSGTVDILSQALSENGGSAWQQFKKGIDESFTWKNQSELLKSTAFLSIVFGGTLKDLAFKKYRDMGGDIKALEEMEHYLTDVRSVTYGAQKYHFDGTKWVDSQRQEVDPEIKKKLEAAYPEAKDGDEGEVRKAATFKDGAWRDESGKKLEGQDLETIIQGLKSRELTHPFIELEAPPGQSKTETAAEPAKQTDMSGETVEAGQSELVGVAQAADGITQPSEGTEAEPVVDQKVQAQQQLVAIEAQIEETQAEIDMLSGQENETGQMSERKIELQQKLDELNATKQGIESVLQSDSGSGEATQEGGAGEAEVTQDVPPGESQGSDGTSGDARTEDAGSVLKQKEFVSKNGQTTVEAHEGAQMWSSDGGVTFTFDQREGSQKANFKRSATLRRMSDGSYYIETKSPVKGKVEITADRGFSLSRAIKAGNTVQKRTLRAARALMPLARSIKKTVNGVEKELKIFIHDAESFSKERESSAGFYDPNTHEVHINMGAAIGNTGVHELLHPIFDAIFEAHPELKVQFYLDVAAMYRKSQPNMDEAIVEYAADRLVYAITPILDRDPGFFAKVLEMLRGILGNYGVDNPKIVITPGTDLSRLIGQIAEVAVPPSINIIQRAKVALKKKQSKELEPGFSGDWTKRAMQLLRINDVGPDGKPLSADAIINLINDRYNELLKFEDDLASLNDLAGDTVLESFANKNDALLLLKEINNNLKEWQDYLRDAKYPIAFKAAILAEVINLNYGPNGYTKRGKADSNVLDKELLEKAFKSKTKNGVLKAMYDARENTDKVQEEKLKKSTVPEFKPAENIEWINDSEALDQVVEIVEIRDTKTGRKIEKSLTLRNKQNKAKKGVIILQKLKDCVDGKA